ncbi:MAG: hypothetical protein H0V44_12635 [Planctomycetes bacterium]|nr:hypothetical protein [Planctomycetota bacterium]
MILRRPSLLLCICACLSVCAQASEEPAGRLAKGGERTQATPSRAPLSSRPTGVSAIRPWETLIERGDIDRTTHRDLLVSAANAGSLAAAQRLIDLGWFDAMRRVEVERPLLASWSRSGEPLGDTTAAAIHAQLWINRLDALPGINATFRAQQQEEALDTLLAAPGGGRPMALLDAACVLAQDGEPQLVERARFYAAGAIELIASAGFAGDDLLLIEGRGEAYLACLDYLDEPDFHAAAVLFADARALRTDAPGRAILLRLGALAVRGAGAEDEAERMMVAASRAFAEVGDHARRGRCLHALGSWSQPDRDGSGDRVRALGWFRQAAAACQRGEDWGVAGDCFAGMAWCLYPDVPDRLAEPDGREPYIPDESGWGRAAVAFAAAAAAHGLDGDGAAQAHDRYSQGLCLDPTLNPMGSWLFAIPVFRAAEVGFAQSADTSARAWNLCVLGEALIGAGDRAASVGVLRQAAGLALQAGERDLLDRVQGSLSPGDS